MESDQVWGGGCLVGGIERYTVKLIRLKRKADDYIACSPPTSRQRQDVGISGKLSVVPGLAVVVGIIFPEDISGGLIEDINLSAISGDGAGTGAVGGDLSPLGIVAGLARVGDFLVVEFIVSRSPDTVHAALSVEGDAVVIIGFAAFIEAGPGKALDTRLVVIDLGLNIREAVGLLLGC